MTMGPQRGARAAAPTGPGRGEAGPRGAAAGTNAGTNAGRDVPATSAASAHDPDFRHSYSRDRAQLLRRLNRIEGQVRGIARMIEREEYCVDILQQTAALRAAIDAVSIMVLEDHVQGCVRTAAERGEADQYVDEVLDVVRRTLGRPIRSASRP
ncbi:MAG: metal-sensitive transcriptional regulator [Chloroflexi bacterium]|jgi:DNA-binding FrmR family transcriptional regulator|nr:metal-sensitive transcriptional regulator [Chloroflexota bacterium]